jgi:sensor histidine kinase YesM
VLQRKKDLIEIGIEGEPGDGMDKEKNAGMRESTGKRPEEMVDAGMDHVKDTVIGRLQK